MRVTPHVWPSSSWPPRPAGTLAVPASAITGGEPDGQDHADVGLIAFSTEDGRSPCSATLNSPAILLTAAHCTEGTLGSTLVTSVIRTAEQPPSLLPVAADPSIGYTPEELAEAGYLSGEALTHPEYSGSTDVANWNDVSIIVLSQPVEKIEPAAVAPLDYLDAFAQPALNRTVVEPVGYGTEVRKPESGPQEPEPMRFPLIRRQTTSSGQELTPQILQLNGNPNDVRGGGTCFGDSGGPVLLNGYLDAVTSCTYTANCRYLGGDQRVDIGVVQDRLVSEVRYRPAA